MGIELDAETCLYTLQFDDQVVCAGDREDLEYMTRKLKEEYDNWELMINISKTKYLCIGAEGENIRLGKNEEITTCKEYKYLGIIFNNQGTDAREIRSRITTAKKLLVV